MLSLYQSKWLIEFSSRQLDVCADNILRTIKEAKNAHGIRDDNRTVILKQLHELHAAIVKAQQTSLECIQEINLAKRIYDADFPSHPNRFFSFDETGNIHEISEQQFRQENPQASELIH